MERFNTEFAEKGGVAGRAGKRRGCEKRIYRRDAESAEKT